MRSTERVICSQAIFAPVLLHPLPQVAGGGAAVSPGPPEQDAPLRDDVLVVAIRSFHDIDQAKQHSRALIVAPHFLLVSTRFVLHEFDPAVARPIEDSKCLPLQGNSVRVAPVQQPVIGLFDAQILRLVDELEA